MPKGTQGMSELELSILTDDERRALEDEDTPEEAAARAKTNAVDDAAAPTAVAPATSGDAQVIETPPPAASSPPTQDAAAPATEEAPPATPDPFVARMPVGEAVDYDAKLGELSKRFEDGEVSTADYNKEMAALIEARTTAKMAAQFNASLEEQLWQRGQDEFFGRHEQYTKSKALYGALSAEVSGIETERAEKKLPPLSAGALLEQAHKNVMREFGQVPPAAQPRAPSRAGHAPDLASVPITLGGIPPADEAETGADRFAALDKLADTNLEEYERQLAKLSPEDLDAYLSV